MHCINAGLNVLGNAPLAVYQVALAEHWLVMGFKTDRSPVDMRLSKMEATIENIVSLTTANNLVVVSQVVETLTDAPKQEKCKLNLRLTSFETKEGEIENELVQQFNTELLQGQMKLHIKVIVAKWQRPATSWASTLTASTCPGAVLLKFAMSEDR
ncbi:unnamed protein product [Sphagnum jensenii]|uniref:Uncharacterized protein n=1 Tax=Sphagnum jensenii TaxID=128206 RepID=A0ABP1AXF3_9BRYO